MTTGSSHATDEPLEFGVPSPALVVRAAAGFERFLDRSGQEDVAEGGRHVVTDADARSLFHEDDHPWLHRTVRDIASRGEGELTAIVHEVTAGRTVRVAHIRPTSGVEWTAAAENIQLVSDAG
ncbi:hypothetical protein [Streptomyces laurentii]|uniref:hypothetical protein n=1 Tax=Streptomyces laurentii TaxID=39478 RepID=UPI00340B3667